jgi:hypothetical protein
VCGIVHWAWRTWAAYLDSPLLLVRTCSDAFTACTASHRCLSLHPADTLGTERAKAQKEQVAHSQSLRELEDRVQVSSNTLRA